MALNCLVHQLVMAIAKMETTKVPATMMVVTVVDLVLILNTAQNANVLEEKLAMMFLMHLLEMAIVMMKPTMLSATMMVGTVVDQTYYVSDFLMANSACAILLHMTCKKTFLN